jgi:hypothetical protein
VSPWMSVTAVIGRVPPDAANTMIRWRPERPRAASCGIPACYLLPVRPNSPAKGGPRQK